MQQRDAIELLVVPADGEVPHIRYATPEALPEISDLPAPCIIALVSRQPRNQIAALRQLARLVPEGVAVTAGVRELLADGRYGFEYLGQHPLGLTGPDTALWRWHEHAGSTLGQPALRNDPASKLSVAVLPFSARGGEAALQDAAWGFSDDITARLTRFRSIEVLARGGAWPWRSSALPASEIGHRLAVRYTLDGLVRPSGANLRIDVSLANTANARAVWAECYQITLSDLQMLATEIAQSVTAAAVHHLQRDALDACPHRPDRRPDGRAQLLTLQGQARLHGMTPEHVEAAAGLANAALDLDPDYPAAHTLRSRCALAALRHGWAADRGQALVQAARDAEAATQADPWDARGFATLGEARLFRRNFDDAERAFKTALSLNPGDADVLAATALGWVHLGRAAEALDLLERAMRLNPYYPDNWLWTEGAAHLLTGADLAALGSALRLQHRAAGHLIAAACHARLGQAEAAQAAAQAHLELEPDFSIAGWRNGLPWRESTGFDLWAEALRQAGLR